MPDKPLNFNVYAGMELPSISLIDRDGEGDAQAWITTSDEVTRAKFVIATLFVWSRISGDLSFLDDRSYKLGRDIVSDIASELTQDGVAA